MFILLLEMNMDLESILVRILEEKQTVYIYAINKQTQSVCSLGTYTVYIQTRGNDAISNGTYVISSSLDDNAVFDISEASMKRWRKPYDLPV